MCVKNLSVIACEDALKHFNSSIEIDGGEYKIKGKKQKGRSDLIAATGPDGKTLGSIQIQDADPWHAYAIAKKILEEMKDKKLECSRNAFYSRRTEILGV